MCEDYRAGATYDVAADEADRGVKKIAAPTQVLWGAKGAVGHWYDVLEVWRPWCENLRGQAIEGAGHFLAEEKPAETLAALADMGHAVQPVRGWGRSLFGRGQIILRHEASGVLCGGSDPRADGCALPANPNQLSGL